MVFANRYFKGIGSTQASSFSPNIVFHSLHYSQESLCHVCFLQFSLLSAQPLCFYISLWNLQIAHGNQFPLGIYHYFRFIRAIKSMQHIDYAHIKDMSQRSFAFAENCFATRCQRTVVSLTPWLQTWTYTEMACVSSWMSGKETSTKKLYFHKEKG